MQAYGSRRVVVTGARSGIGFATAVAFARAGADVTIVTRDGATGADAAHRIAGLAGSRRAPDAEQCDLSLMKDVQALAGRLSARGPIDTLVNCAGVERWTRTQTAEGLELTFAANVMAPYLLTAGLADSLARSERGCAIAIGSIVHRWARIDWNDLQSCNRYDAQTVYFRSKLALLLVQSALASRLADRGVAVHTLEPGMTRTDFARDFRGFPGIMASLCRPFMRDPKIVADEVASLANRDDLIATTGEYWFKGAPRIRSDDARDVGLAERMWRACSSIAAVAPGATG